MPMEDVLRTTGRTLLLATLAVAAVLALTTMRLQFGDGGAAPLRLVDGAERIDELAFVSDERSVLVVLPLLSGGAIGGGGRDAADGSTALASCVGVIRATLERRGFRGVHVLSLHAHAFTQRTQVAFVVHPANLCPTTHARAHCFVQHLLVDVMAPT
eukprot:CAMPEP_0198349066 /NCGR_PEP_ID=MMETSP1450-20131203/92424_1 /TAXON_ID=753684 ORGANISM="Madagascaria erythrocladiodes, Strain CCMP3234" /NCGR_SAMPLE_ID=MMETSP1450 /ASSEMBLY_ACC=CAM_ASM_001115 /LENGTH=156 /DNA_ID=CAMNT_0044054723 /DNA_START=90 /DNA_END=557 /DNA_ORIENTATION=-